MMSREYTKQEVKQKFLEDVIISIREWDNYPKMTTTRRLEGLAFSIMAIIDGASANVPSFLLAPLPCPEDKPYHIGNGNNYYPENKQEQVNCDIGGSLHDELSRMLKGGNDE